MFDEFTLIPACSGSGVVVRAQDGSTALICAARYGHTECVRLLAESGADKEAKTIVRFMMFLYGCALFPY